MCLVKIKRKDFRKEKMVLGITGNTVIEVIFTLTSELPARQSKIRNLMNFIVLISVKK